MRKIISIVSFLSCVLVENIAFSQTAFLGTTLPSLYSSTFSSYPYSNNYLQYMSHDNFSDTLTKKEEKKGLFRHSRFLLNFDSRQSFILDKKAKMNGLKLGIEFYDKYRFGLGWYSTDTPIKLRSIETSEDTITQQLRFDYSTFFMEYVLYEDYKWEFSIPLSIGGGTGNLEKHYAVRDTTILLKSESMTVITLSIGGHYKVFHWLGIGSGLGFRQTITKNKHIRDAFNSPFYVIKVKLFLGDLYKSIFKHEDVLVEKKAYKEHREEKRKARKQNNEDD